MTSGGNGRRANRDADDSLIPGALLCPIVPAFCPAQVEETATGGRCSPAVDLPHSVLNNGTAPGLEPPAFLYQAPLRKVVGAFAGKLELKSAHPPHYKPGTVLCSLEVKDKILLFARDTFDPVSLLEAAVEAGPDQASNRDPTFGQGLGAARVP